MPTSWDCVHSANFYFFFQKLGCHSLVDKHIFRNWWSVKIVKVKSQWLPWKHTSFHVEVLIWFVKHICITKNMETIFHNTHHMDGVVQERHNSIADTLELHLSCTNRSICDTRPRWVNLYTNFNKALHIRSAPTHICNDDVDKINIYKNAFCIKPLQIRVMSRITYFDMQWKQQGFPHPYNLWFYMNTIRILKITNSLLQLVGY